MAGFDVAAGTVIVAGPAEVLLVVLPLTPAVTIIVDVDFLPDNAVLAADVGEGAVLGVVLGSWLPRVEVLAELSELLTSLLLLLLGEDFELAW